MKEGFIKSLQPIGSDVAFVDALPWRGQKIHRLFVAEINIVSQHLGIQEFPHILSSVIGCMQVERDMRW